MNWVDGETPEGWKLRQLGDVADVVGGGTPKTGLAENFSEVAGHPWITPADLAGYRDKYISRGRRFLTDQGFARSSAKIMPVGTVLFSSRAPIGYVAIASEPISTNQGFRSFIPTDEIDSEYLYFALQFLRPLAEQLASGTTFPEISGSNAARLPIAYPPLPTQQAIARTLSLATDHEANASSHLSAAHKIISSYRQTVLAAAASGRLTADWREKNPEAAAQSPLADITAKRQQVLGSKKHPKVPSVSDRLIVPEQWAITSLDAISARITSGSRDWSPFYGRGSGTFDMAQNVRRGYLDWTFRQSVDPPAEDRSRERSQIAAGDLLVTIVGANTGDVGPVMEERAEHYVCQSVALVRPADVRLAGFVNLWFNSPLHGRQYLDECSYGAGRPHLSFDQIKSAPVAIPSFAEQVEITKRASLLLTKAEAISTRIIDASTAVNRLSRAILTKAFCGGLPVNVS